MPEVEIREVTEADSAALADLARAAADSGAVSFSPRFNIPAVQAVSIRHPGTRGVVAETAAGQVVGVAWVSVTECRIDGERTPCGILHTLAVHPDWRRQGIARDLTTWRVRVVGPGEHGAVLVAGIQTGNSGSFANSQRWATQMLGNVTVTPVPMRRRAPRQRRDVEVREASIEDLPAIAAGLSDVYQDHELGPEYDAEFLTAWLGTRYADLPLARYLVADVSGRILAGLGIVNVAALMTLHVDSLPAMLRLVNRVVKVVPPDGEMRNLSVVMPWYRTAAESTPDKKALGAARYLWQWARADASRDGTAIITAFDKRSPVRRMLQVPPWLPSTTISLAVRAPVNINPARLIDPYHVV